MKTLKEFIDELYNSYMKEVAVSFNDPGLYERFYLAHANRYGKWFEKYKDNKEMLLYRLERWAEDAHHDFVERYKTLEARYYQYTEDPNFSLLSELAARSCRLAKEKYHGREFSDDDIHQIKTDLDEIDRLCDLVPEFFTRRAYKLRSEAIVEYNYIAGISPHYSLRLAEYIDICKQRKGTH